MKHKKVIIAFICIAVLAVGGFLTYIFWPKPQYLNFDYVNVLGYKLGGQQLLPPEYALPIIDKNLNGSSMLPYTTIRIIPIADYFEVYKPKKISFKIYSKTNITLSGSVSFVMGSDLAFDVNINANKNVSLSFSYTGTQSVQEIKIYFINNTKDITVFNTKIEVA